MDRYEECIGNEIILGTLMKQFINIVQLFDNDEGIRRSLFEYNPSVWVCICEEVCLKTINATFSLNES